MKQPGQGFVKMHSDVHVHKQTLGARYRRKQPSEGAGKQSFPRSNQPWMLCETSSASFGETCSVYNLRKTRLCVVNFLAYPSCNAGQVQRQGCVKGLRDDPERMN